MSAILTFSNANPLRMVITSWSNRNDSDRDYKFFREFSLPKFDSFFQPFLNTDILTVQFDSSFDLTNIVTLKNYYTGATINTSAATEKDDRGTYKVFEKAISIVGLDGLYYVEVTGTDSDTETFTARSEPLSINPTQCDTVKLEYYNDDSAFGIDYETTAVKFDIRVPAIFNRTADTTKQELFKDSGGNSSLVSAEGTRVRVLKANELLPQWFIEKVNLALLHDNVDIDGVAVSSEQSWPYEQISDKKLWAEPEANIILESGSSAYVNTHFSGDQSQEGVVENSDDSYNDTVAGGSTLILPDINITKNDDSIVTSPSVKHLDLRVIDPPPSGWDEQVAEYGRGYNYPIPTGQTTIYRTGDDADIEATIFAPIRVANSLKVHNSLVDFETLGNTNVFGNTNRFTDSVGGSVYGVGNGSITDYIIDNYTGIGYHKPISPGNWNDAIDNSLASTQSGFSDWLLTPLNILKSIWKLGNSLDIGFYYFPFDTSVITPFTKIISSSTDARPTINYIYMQGAQGSVASLLKTTVGNYIMCRRHF